MLLFLVGVVGSGGLSPPDMYFFADPRDQVFIL